MADQLDVGLALSGGGYRAMLYSLGSAWRLNELGWLRKIDAITSVSGGSILNGVLATRWNQLTWSPQGVATNFVPVVAAPVRAMAGKTLDVFAGVEGLLSIFSTIADKVAESYDENLFHGAKLADIPSFDKGRTPRFIFYSTSLQTGSSVRIEKKRLADYRLGVIPDPDLSVARAVTASSAFPPVLSPVEIKLDPALWQPVDGATLHGRDDLKKRLLLTDGGVYDNMGLEAIWDRCGTVLVSDAGAPLNADASPPTDWTRQAIRVLDIVSEQTRALRKRHLIDAFQAGKKGTYWGIPSRIGDYGVANPMTQDNLKTEALQHIRTRLAEFKPVEQGQLINWGYALTDAGMRRYVDPANAAPGAWPVPEFALQA